MEFQTKVAIVVAEDLQSWQKLNVVSFLTSGIVGQSPQIIGEIYIDKSGKEYSPLSIQPTIILKTSREKLQTILQRAKSKEITVALYIEDMFATGHDSANRETVRAYKTENLPVVGIGIRAEKKIVDKVTRGAKLHE
ncbi:MULTISPECIES: DUF2000 family protein [Arcobacteraceae]|uniref:DUF2000 family protein n=2 Tax=Arcobacteraceae TaxID=2808963 RepID=A0A5R8Y3C6_9BACT|nr:MULTISPECIES: DUF2000 family protein [Arcobacteraceae]QKF81837.1 DUF2000 domain-containing protein [Halarcobacter ebronensis]RXK01565.1 hypothetical protein CRV07_14905 [Halarcobacter ebronensis]TLP39579.1 DUF2000 family protein [Arcobacter arenosus]